MPLGRTRTWEHSPKGKQWLKTYAKQYWIINKDHLANLGKIDYKRRKLEVLSYYSKGIPHCACCGIRELQFLTIDHINNDGKDYSQNIRRSLYWYLKRSNFPKGYQVLCWNCNCAKRLSGSCPHNNKEVLIAGQQTTT